MLLCPVDHLRGYYKQEMNIKLFSTNKMSCMPALGRASSLSTYSLPTVALVIPVKLNPPHSKFVHMCYLFLEYWPLSQAHLHLKF